MPHQKAHSGGSGARRMRLSVTSNPQNALFRKMRFSSPGQTRRRLTEKRILAGRLTEKRILWLRRDGKAQSGPRPQSIPHGKAHSARWASRKSALCWLGARRMRLYVTSNPRMRFSVECAFSHLRKCGVGSRKSALWQPLPHGKAQSGPRPQSTPHGKAHSAYDRALDVTE